MNTLLLVVDDDLDDLELFQGALSQIDDPPELKYFLNGEALLTFFKDRANQPLPPFAISLDINLPGINGIALLAILKKELGLYHVPISMLSTSSSPQQKEQCLQYGASHFFTKPIRTSDWLNIVELIVREIDLTVT